MAKSKSDNRTIAKRMWLNTNGEIKLKEIAEKLGTSEALVRKWKSQDKWNLTESLLEEEAPKKPKKSTKAKAKPSLNLQEGNKNAVKTGLYEKIFFDSLDDEEVTLISSIDDNRIKALERELALLTVREYRIMKRIKETQERASMLSTIHNRKVKDGGGNLVGDEISTYSLSSFEALNKLDDALTKIQDKKVRTIETICKIEIEYERLNLEKGIVKTNIESITNWLSATSLNATQVSSLFVEGEIVDEEEE